MVHSNACSLALYSEVVPASGGITLSVASLVARGTGQRSVTLASRFWLMLQNTLMVTLACIDVNCVAAPTTESLFNSIAAFTLNGSTALPDMRYVMSVNSPSMGVNESTRDFSNSEVSTLWCRLQKSSTGTFGTFPRRLLITIPSLSASLTGGDPRRKLLTWMCPSTVTLLYVSSAPRTADSFSTTSTNISLPRVEPPASGRCETTLGSVIGYAKALERIPTCRNFTNAGAKLTTGRECVAGMTATL
ncbi:hypothetical protein BBBOND_0103420 [Babesia bigemina]|uniref:Uncharacterized protein n=1 Tax=Babesia bigemina TaxID=5866 RepID=A0A061D030_BABBI|nr:hypothetical protein BBBOND_0103420 [Babesia bigemina]CDR94028.1 hypothetical protein BBBOND_0103420 [Babesia bigemina]|eukprot:XP_012766214.1 hypothetical protein BBBOND_0103420 [Babesia bigemina]